MQTIPDFQSKPVGGSCSHVGKSPPVLTWGITHEGQRCRCGSQSSHAQQSKGKEACQPQVDCSFSSSISKIHKGLLKHGWFTHTKGCVSIRKTNTLVWICQITHTKTGYLQWQLGSAALPVAKALAKSDSLGCHQSRVWHWINCSSAFCAGSWAKREVLQHITRVK